MLEKERDGTEEDQVEPLVIPAMEQNVLCLDHDIMMNRVR